MITKAEFEAYEAVRTSGVTNMFAIGIVSELSGLENQTIKDIMKNYGELCKQYPEVRK